MHGQEQSQGQRVQVRHLVPPSSIAAAQAGNHGQPPSSGSFSANILAKYSIFPSRAAKISGGTSVRSRILCPTARATDTSESRGS